MKTFSKYVFLLSLVSISFSAMADDYFGADVHLLQEDTGLTTVTTEFWWKKGRFRGFGFCDNVDFGDEYYCNNTLDVDISGPFFISAEVGWANFGNFQKIGPGVQLAEILRVDSWLLYLNASLYAKAWGADSEQLKLTWRTRNWGLSDSVSVYSSGFARFIQDSKDVYQPQFWITFGDSPIELGNEIAFFGTSRTYLLALKYNF